MSNVSGQQLAELEVTARALLTMHRGRGSEAIFLTIANAWYVEKEAACTNPRLPLTLFGKMLGLDAVQIDRARKLASTRAQSARRILIGGSSIKGSGNGNRANWLVPQKGKVHA